MALVTSGSWDVELCACSVTFRSVCTSGWDIVAPPGSGSSKKKKYVD